LNNNIFCSVNEDHSRYRRLTDEATENAKRKMNKENCGMENARHGKTGYKWKSEKYKT